MWVNLRLTPPALTADAEACRLRRLCNLFLEAEPVTQKADPELRAIMLLGLNAVLGVTDGADLLLGALYTEHIEAK
jgi:hypothetical protein